MASLLNIRLIPFYLSVGAYFIIYGSEPSATMVAAIFKALPIWFLALFVHKTEESLKTDYSHMFTHALALSSLGDICLIWHKALFIPGMLFFAGAHVCYLHGLLIGFTKRISFITVLFAILGILMYSFISDGIHSLIMKILVFIYESLIVGVGCLAFKRYVYTSTTWAGFAASGYALFMISDGLLAVNEWKIYVPLSGLFIMLSYYAAQMCLAHSTVKV